MRRVRGAEGGESRPSRYIAAVVWCTGFLHVGMEMYRVEESMYKTHGVSARTVQTRRVIRSAGGVMSAHGVLARSAELRLAAAPCCLVLLKNEEIETRCMRCALLLV